MFRKSVRVWYLTIGSCSESLYESDELPKQAHDAAALLASKVYYYLGEYDEALSFALGAGSAFEAESRVPGAEEYVETVVCECLIQCLCLAALTERCILRCSQSH